MRGIDIVVRVPRLKVRVEIFGVLRVQSPDAVALHLEIVIGLDLGNIVVREGLTVVVRKRTGSSGSLG